MSTAEGIELNTLRLRAQRHAAKLLVSAKRNDFAKKQRFA